MPYRVLIVDDSLLVRGAVGEILSRIPDVQICGKSPNGLDAITQIQELKPDLVILDIEMPVMDGMTALRELRLRKIKVPILMLSVLTQHGARTTFEALELGALDFIPKPSAQAGMKLQEVEDLLIAKVTELMQMSGQSAFHAHSSPLSMEEKSQRKFELLVIGSSTGGPQSLHKIFQQIKEPFPAPILIVQHMPPVFTAAFAERLGQISVVEAMEARDGMPLRPNCAFVAPGNQHMGITGQPGQFTVTLSDEAPILAHRPSIDHTLKSVVRHFGGKAAGLIMTGMGRDGVDGMLQLHASGGLTLSQNEASSVVFGMNRRAIEAGAVDLVLDLAEIPEVLAKYF